MQKPPIQDLSRAELTAACAELGAPAYRAGQLWRWLYVQLAADWDAMTNLPRDLRARLAERYDLAPAREVRVAGAAAGTRKILVGLADGECVETVLIPAADRRTVCVSAQVGCKFACAFCASGQAGFRRDLSPGEMVGQVVLAARAFGERVSHVVFMGRGEPLDNYDAVLRAVRIINDPDGLGIGARRITLSTCGVIPGIERLAGEGLQVELSISLHAPDDELRTRLMPVNRKYPLASLLQAARAYTEKTNRIITFEYTLVRGLNDAPEQAEALAGRLAGLPCRVNLIPLSPVREFAGAAPAAAAVEGFRRALQRRRINCTVRESRGAALDAACGQLRRRTLAEA